MLCLFIDMFSSLLKDSNKIRTFPFYRHLPLPSRPMAPFRWYGGKGMLVKWILPWVKWGKVYVEPFCGAASVFWNKRSHHIEVLNDIDKDVMNVFRCLQDEILFRELAHRLAWTSYSRAEFERALKILNEGGGLVDRAWAFMVSQGQGFGGRGVTPGHWGRAFESGKGMALTASSWRSRIALLRWWHDRLTGVQLDCQDALGAIKHWDTPETLFYIDPPYPHSTRIDKNSYQHEMTDDHHRRLLELLLAIKGQAVVSTYPNEMYESYLRSSGWIELRKRTVCHAAGRTRDSCLRGKGAARKGVPRTEVLWISPKLFSFLSFGRSVPLYSNDVFSRSLLWREG